jgi:hypothetical protein
MLTDTALLNVFTALAASAFTVMILIVLLHALLWPALGKMINPLLRFKVFRQRKLIFGVGSILVLYAIVSNEALREKLFVWLMRVIAIS